MLKTKKRKLLSLLLAITVLTVSIIIPSSSASATVGTDTQIFGGMVLTKTVEETDEEDKYKVTLGAYSTGEGYTIETEVSRPVDIILVIDESGSMDYSFKKNGKETVTRWEATQEAVNSFISNVKKDADEYKVNHRIAVVTYAGGSYIYKGTSRYKYSNVYSSSYYDKSSYKLVKASSNRDYYSIDALFEKVGNEYKKVTVTRKEISDGMFSSHYQYTYSFSDGTSVVSNYQDTVPSLGEREFYTYQSSILNTAFQDVTVSSQLENLKKTIGDGSRAYPGAIDPDGGTYPADAVEMAYDIFDAYKDDYNTADKRGKIVIYFTDGMPGDGDTFDGSEGSKTISNFKRIKDIDATVYSIGVFPKANCSNPQNLPDNSGNDNKANRFMFLTSSYYPDATSMESIGAIVSNYEDKSFYMSPQDVESLTDTFTVISGAIHKEYTEVVCTEKAMIKDVITPYFAGPTDVSKIKAYYQACTGIDPDNDKLRTFASEELEAEGLEVYIENYPEDSEEDVTVVGDIPNDTVIATNFDYKTNWCGLDDGKPRGHRVVLEFYITVRPEFLGGNGVPTNQAISGLYDDEGKLLPGFEFPMPKPRDIEIKDFSIEVKAETKNVYLHSDLTKKQMDMGAYIKVLNEDKTENCILYLDKENYGLSLWKVDHIDVQTKCEKAPLKDIVADTTYDIDALVSPKVEEGECKPKSGKSDAADVLVYVPRITYKDSVINAGETPDYDDNLVKVDWVHKNDKGEWTTCDKMVGTAPKLDFVYSPTEGTIWDDTPVKVTKVLMDVDGNGTCETDITSYCLFDHSTCTVDKCSFDSSKSQFVVHTLNATANIVIKNTGETVDEKDTFVFTVTSDADKNYKQKVVVKGKGTAVIKGLPVGKYTVTEDTGWSYTYECESENPQEKTIIGEPQTSTLNVFTFENSKKKDDNIRTAWDYIKNLFKSTGIVSSH